MIEHIQINPVAPRVAYAADGVQSAFTYPFAIFAPADIEVWLDDIRQNSGFSVSGAGISTGGAVLFAVPPAAGSRVTLRRRLAIGRTSDFQADGIIRAKTLNDEFDLQVADDAGRAVVRAVTSASTADLTLPEPAPGQAIGWNADGTGLANDPGDLQAKATIATQQAAIATTARQAAEAAAAQAEAAAAAASGDMRRANNLSDMTDFSAARAHLGVAASSHGHVAADLTDFTAAVQAVIDQQPADASDARLAFLEINLAVNTLRDQIDTGWSVLKMAGGVADEFEDTSGIGSSDGTYDTAGDYIHNPGTASAAAILTGASATGSYGALPSDTIDGTLGAEFGWLGTGYSGKEIRYDAGSAISASKIRQYTTTASTCVAGWELYGGNNADYTTGRTLVASSASSGAFANSDGWQEKSFTASTPYRYWAVVPTSGTNGVNTANHPNLIEFELWKAAGAPTNITVVSAATAALAGASDTEARIVLLHQPVDPVTLNTDVTIEVSRDNGTSWTAGALTLQGAFDATTNILTATIDLSGQPPGTSMKWRFRTLNAKEQRLHGVWMQWR
ncbi:hypothetical protein MTBLM5_30193 [Magnetospirillum sp. LM-5]|uniref:hypothetical protein n=1 Tax=Magnetospirillum sp. LM-5 TaxID=2681466 RepID=UPI0013860B09|nr:hypothetical protein [Magnetospirillum sp. LM-5]CAA7619536.1 hypothetical protein MTBLM5_30193 [Magnetospirillum sp. LM-5]